MDIASSRRRAAASRSSRPASTAVPRHRPLLAAARRLVVLVGAAIAVTAVVSAAVRRRRSRSGAARSAGHGPLPRRLLPASCSASSPASAARCGRGQRTRRATPLGGLFGLGIFSAGRPHGDAPTSAPTRARPTWLFLALGLAMIVAGVAVDPRRSSSEPHAALTSRSCARLRDMTSGFSPSCDCTRALLSRQLDAPLSELERRAVARHADGCAACRRSQRDSRWITEELRTAPLEPLPPARDGRQCPRRRSPIRVVANVASAAALLVGRRRRRHARVAAAERRACAQALDASARSTRGSAIR